MAALRAQGEMMADQFKDKVAIVTGGASGLGQALCEALCKRGAHVIVADIDVTRAQQLALAICATGGRARAAHLDVANFDLVQRLVSDTASEYGHFDYMFNNAAATATRGELRDLPLEPWYRAIDVNLLGVLYGTIAAYSVMIRQGFGHIVNTGSIAGLVGFPTSIPYGATKSAVVNLSVALRTEAAELGVKVSVVCPGPIHGEERQHVKLIGIERAAQLMLNGVERNKAIIVFPLLARVLWWLHRLSPNLLFLLGRKFMRDYRRKRMACPEASMGHD
jgi:NAD(P)-dependent dehydrogenase (short-subunit alcohol dehydrogenase family)